MQYDSNRYSVLSEYASRAVSCCAPVPTPIVVVAGNEIIADHKRRFTRNVSFFEPWHFVPLLDRKPGVLRDGAPFVGWETPLTMAQVKDHDMQGNVCSAYAPSSFALRPDGRGAGRG